MLFSKDGVQIKLTTECNNSTTVWGKSGSGKTYYYFQEIKKFIQNKIPVVIIDWSYAYTRIELAKTGLSNEVSQIQDIVGKGIVMPAGADKMKVSERVADALMEALKCRSYIQSDLLRNACFSVMHKHNCITFQKLTTELELMLSLEEDSDCRKNIGYLLQRLMPIKNLKGMKFVTGVAKYQPNLYIYQISGLGMKSRKIVSRVLTEILWQNLRCRQVHSRIQVVLDEVQDIDISGTAIEEMIREGRRLGIGVTLLSQFAPKGNDLDVVEQADTLVCFKPNDKNLQTLAKLLDLDDWKTWHRILRNLKRGECAIKGMYMVNGKISQSSKPLMCIVKSKGDVIKNDGK